MFSDGVGQIRLTYAAFVREYRRSFRRLHMCQYLLQPLNRISGFGQSLLLRESDSQIASHFVRKNGRVINRANRTHYLT
jgi:hypothetical protein